MGLEGDQNIEFAQNKTLANSTTTGIKVYLFEVFEKGKYFYRGQIKLSNEPYQEKQLDEKNKLRLVWVFPLKLVNEKYKSVIPKSVISKKQDLKEKEARRLSDKELFRRAKLPKEGKRDREVTTKVSERDPYVSEIVKRMAKGICQLCGSNAPFIDKNRRPYLESHHIIWLSKGGEDTIENSSALCPNCHRKMHSLNLKEDIKKLKQTNG